MQAWHKAMDRPGFVSRNVSLWGGYASISEYDSFLPPQLFVKNLCISSKEIEKVFSTHGEVFAVQPHQSRPEITYVVSEVHCNH